MSATARRCRRRRSASSCRLMHELIAIAFATIRPLFLSGTTVSTKSDASPVTLADRNAEAAMRRLIERRYPEHAIVGEEHGVKDGRDYRWVLDPIDGTRAFITQLLPVRHVDRARALGAWRLSTGARRDRTSRCRRRTDRAPARHDAVCERRLVAACSSATVRTPRGCDRACHIALDIERAAGSERCAHRGDRQACKAVSHLGRLLRLLRRWRPAPPT